MKLCASLFAILFTFNALAETGDFRTADENLNGIANETECATGVFANALAETAKNVSEYDDEQTIQQWIHQTFADPNVLSMVLECPEFATANDTDHIKMQPIQYVFPGGREIVINYETQPKILKQRIAAATRRDINTLNEISPKIGAIDDTSTWTNTDPAWYAIMVTQHGALDEFVGSTKNNTVSMKYIEDNIDALYPHGATCTSKTAIASDNDIVNLATHVTVGLDDDSNDYYVAGDKSLHWLSYMEIAADVVITVVTWGGGAIVAGATKSARATRAMNGLRQTLRTLRASPEVIKYIKLEQKVQKNTITVARIKKYQQLEKELAALDKTRDAAEYTKTTNELRRVTNELRDIDKITNMTPQQAKRLKELQQSESKILAAQQKNPSSKEARELSRQLESVRQERNSIFNKTSIPDNTVLNAKIQELEKESAQLTKEMSDTVKKEKNVKTFVDARKSYGEIQEYRLAYKNLKRAQTGNIVARGWKALRATAKGNKTIDKGARIARQSLKSGRVRDWLFNSTLKNVGALGRLESAGGALYGAINFIGGMYDWTEVSTGDYTNDVEFKPLLLLSADDLAGQENIVNHGMWLLWQGNSTDPADDDAAYLQAMDFAEKFHTDLIDTMAEQNSNACDIDIYVVRPVLRNPETNPELYYLIMNDKPWTTAE